ncbi:MAG: cobyrinate a,c-diamide synthase [Candidatus Tectomicrobia bacterium]|nr:cobyrinate a,c-diamide synthase [Candidatus Tectomicrobia bacterium]
MAASGSLVIAGTHSGVGKTTITLGLLAALRKRGVRVQPFKAGPDFIDPGHHRSAAGVPSHNLDSWMLSPPALARLYARYSREAEVCLIEGVMGLFDGSSGLSEEGSTAQIAKRLGAPVVLVVDAGSMARSGAAVVLGFEQFDPDLALAGVIFNRVGGEGHYRYLDEAMRSRCRSSALGYVLQNDAISMPERHLGLVTSAELSLPPEFFARLAAAVEAHVDLDRLLALARRYPPAPAGSSTDVAGTDGDPRWAAVPRGQARPRIGVAFDEVFCFYYEENLELLRRLGAELVLFSPLRDATLPPGLQGLYLGGGYPEVFAARLEANGGMRLAITQFAAAQQPIYAECGGFMYLCEAIIDAAGAEHEMVGVFPGRTRMVPRLSAIGYVEVEQTAPTILAPAGMRARGHEFHYSELLDMPASVPRAYRLRSGREERSAAPRAEGYQIGRCLGGYVHLHFSSNPQFAHGFVASCAGRGKGFSL